MGTYIQTFYVYKTHPLIMNTSAQYVALIVLFLGTNLTNGHPDGAPLTACAAMTPGHVDAVSKEPIAPQPDSSFPYNLAVGFGEKKVLKAGDSVPITLSSDFQGFMIEARQDGAIIGSFDLGGDTKIKAIDCEPGMANAITHTTPVVKESISATWI